jgi:hypothetical protein
MEKFEKRRKVYFKPQTMTTSVVYSDYVMREYSWTSGNNDDFPIIPGNPDDPGTTDPYGGGEGAKKFTPIRWGE